MFYTASRISYHTVW